MTVTLPDPWYIVILPFVVWAAAFGLAYALGRSYASRGHAAAAQGWGSPLIAAGALVFLKHWLYDGHAWHQSLFSLVLLTSGAAGLSVGTRRVLGHRRRNNLCLHCGYNLTGNVSGVCPECGTSISRRTASRDD